MSDAERASVLAELLRQIKRNPGADEADLVALQSGVGTLPRDYLDFLRGGNGGVGHGPDLWVILEPARRVVEATSGYGAPEGLVIIGSDGLGNVLGIDVRGRTRDSMKYVRLDPVVMELDEVEFSGASLLELLGHVAERRRRP